MPLGCEYPPEIELATIRAKEAFLRQEFLKVAKVTNHEKGYVSVPFINQLVNPRSQGFAADLIVYHCQSRGCEIDKVVQIPNSGNPLATTVAERLNTPLAPGRKGKAIPGAWSQPIVIEETSPSFTTGESSTFTFNGLEPGDKILLVDDVVAHGDTSLLVIKKLREKGIIITELAVYFAKLFQPGVEKLQEETGINPFYVIGVQEIFPDGTLSLAPPHF